VCKYDTADSPLEMSEKRMDDLDYEKHLSLYRHLFSNFAAGSEYAEKQAQYAHAMAIFNRLRDWIGKAYNIANHLRNEKAHHYMIYGAGRRLNMIFYAYRNLILTATPQRVSPLSYEEQLRLCLDVNIIYMNIPGVLDNFAWAFLYEKEPGAIQSLSRMEISLFSRKFRLLLSFSKIEEEISSHDSWNKDVKNRRDPVAHRIPLYVPPSILNQNEADSYKQLCGEYLENIQEVAFEKADANFEELNHIGRFLPHFVHDPEQGPIPIYPTIPTDMSHLIRIGNTIEWSLLKTG
jgi:uncharacterized protein YozE (UPF0346 family)